MSNAFAGGEGTTVRNSWDGQRSSKGMRNKRKRKERIAKERADRELEKRQREIEQRDLEFADEYSDQGD